jgi:diaminopimelate epimerase
VVTGPIPFAAPFAKGHGTGNDFLLLPDPDGELTLTPDQVAALCHRRTGVGADGLLRAVRGADGGWFMDYRNADGSLAEMCGNGIRVFARYLVEAGLADAGELGIGTRAGTRTVRVPADEGPVAVAMGVPVIGPAVSVAVSGERRPATAVDVGNPHAVVRLASLAELTSLGAVLTAPEVRPATAFPEGVTVEYAVVTSPSQLTVRVHERGVGETLACGTGACAVVAATTERPGRYTVDYPGGRLRVHRAASGAMTLEGDARIVARGTVVLPA